MIKVIDNIIIIITKQKSKISYFHMVFFSRIQLLHFMNDYMMSCTANQM